VRLFGSERKTVEGRLEVYYNKTWGTVCDRGFTDIEAKVACNGLGFGYVVYSHEVKYIARLKLSILKRLCLTFYGARNFQRILRDEREILFFFIKR